MLSGLTGKIFKYRGDRSDNPFKKENHWRVRVLDVKGAWVKYEFVGGSKDWYSMEYYVFRELYDLDEDLPKEEAKEASVQGRRIVL